MTEKEIQDIFHLEMERHEDARIALMNTQHSISSAIFQRLVRPKLNDGDWELLLSVSYVKSRLSLFLNIPGNSQVVLVKKQLEDALYTYERWLTVTKYLHDNFDNLDSSEFKENCTKDGLLKMKEYIETKYAGLKHEFAQKDLLSLDHNEFVAMDQLFTWFQRLLAGKEIFMAYIQEFNVALPILRKYQSELLSPAMAATE
jgi:hypothetical protein